MYKVDFHFYFKFMPEIKTKQWNILKEGTNTRDSIQLSIQLNKYQNFYNRNFVDTNF